MCVCVCLRQNLGGVLFGMAEFERAIPVFERAAAARPHDANMHKNLASARVKHGQYGAAVDAYSAALAVEHDDTQRALSVVKRAYCRQQTADWSDWYGSLNTHPPPPWVGRHACERKGEGGEV